MDWLKGKSTGNHGFSKKDGGFLRWGVTPKWIVYSGKSTYKWMIWGYPNFRTPYTHILMARKNGSDMLRLPRFRGDDLSFFWI